MESNEWMRNLINMCEDQPTTGVLPAQELAKLLPNVANLNYFTSALEKIENGQERALTVQEKSELANAFISLVNAEDFNKTKIIQKMMPVTQKKAPQQPVTQPTQTNQAPQRL